MDRIGPPRAATAGNRHVGGLTEVYKMKRMLLPAAVMAAAILMMPGCDKPNNKARVTVVYDQLLNFGTYKLSPSSSSTTGPGSGIYVMYKIKSITNTGSEAKIYEFRKDRIVAVTPDNTSNEEPGADNILLGAHLAHQVTVPAGQTVNNPGCIIKTVLTANPQDYANTSGLVDILHQINQSQPVTMKRAPSDLDTGIVINAALPSLLQSKCASG